MSKVDEICKSHHIQLALATGASIIALAYVSKRILTEPMDNLAMAFPPFLAVIGQYVIAKNTGSWIGETRYWILAILLSTALVITLHLI